MNNTTIEICTITSYYNNAVQISYISWRLCGLLCTIFGVPGHLFLILIMSNKTNRKDPTSLYFIAIAICELIFLFGIFWLWCVGMSLVKIDPRQMISCGTFYSILIGPTILSNLYFASISIDRTLMILSPIRYRQVITRRRILIRIFLIFILIIFVMIPHQFYYYYNKQTTLFICEFHPFIHKWRIRIWPYIHAILFVSIPSIITCISSIILLQNRCKYRRRTNNKLSDNARLIERNSIMRLFISIAIFFSLLPFVILQIFIVHDQLLNHIDFCSIRWKTYRILLNWFLTLGALNYSAKFYIRLAISRTFRRDSMQLLKCIVRRKDETNEQQLVPLSEQKIIRNSDSVKN